MDCLATLLALLASLAPIQGAPVVTLAGTELPLASGALPGGNLGWDIAIDGDTLVTGWSSAPGSEAVAELVPVPGEDRAGFGMQVAVSGDTIAVGAPNSITGGLPNAGRVYLFRRDLGGPSDHPAGVRRYT